MRGAERGGEGSRERSREREEHSRAWLTDRRKEGWRREARQSMSWTAVRPRSANANGNGADPSPPVGDAAPFSVSFSFFLLFSRLSFSFFLLFSRLSSASSSASAASFPLSRVRFCRAGGRVPSGSPRPASSSSSESAEDTPPRASTWLHSCVRNSTAFRSKGVCTAPKKRITTFKRAHSLSLRSAHAVNPPQLNQQIKKSKGTPSPPY